MKGDFSRDTFDPLNNFSRVLMQQGRVQLDADFNEQAAILLHMLRRLTADVLGPYAIPAADRDGLRVTVKNDAGNRRLTLGGGRAYVGGYLVEVRGDPLLEYPDPLEANKGYIAYLEVWERHVTYHETAALIREVALGGPDTASRAQVVYALRVTDSLSDDSGERIVVNVDLDCDRLHARWPRARPAPAFMRARAAETRSDEACVVPSDARYRGLENQLYRVEVHRGGAAGVATFKWSRDNGSVVFPLAAPVANSDTVTLLNLGRDERFGVQPGDWVEIVNDDISLEQRAEKLLQVAAVDPLERTVTLSGAITGNMDLATRPLLRRWDQRAAEEGESGLTLVDGAAQMWRDNAANLAWLPLEDGIEVQFADTGEYRTGDYWLIPARTATGSIEWPQDAATGGPAEVAARSSARYTMPLAIVMAATPGTTAPEVRDCRLCFGPVATADCNPR